MLARVSRKDKNPCLLCFFKCHTLRLDGPHESQLSNGSGSAMPDKQHSPAGPPPLLHLESKSQICGEKQLGTPAKASWGQQPNLSPMLPLFRSHPVPLHKPLYLPHTVSSCPSTYLPLPRILSCCKEVLVLTPLNLSLPRPPPLPSTSNNQPGAHSPFYSHPHPCKPWKLQEMPSEVILPPSSN